MDFAFGVGIGFLLGFKICAYMSGKHMERMKKIWLTR